MLSNDPADRSQPSSSTSRAEAGTAGNSDECARKPIETAPEPGGTINDPGANDRKPPNVDDFNRFLG